MDKWNKCKYCITHYEMGGEGFYHEVYYCMLKKDSDWNACHFCGRGICCGVKCEKYEPRSSKHKNCQNTTKENPVDDFVCSKCGIHLSDWHRIDGEDWFEYEFKYCPNCGAKVVEE